MSHTAACRRKGNPEKTNAYLDTALIVGILGLVGLGLYKLFTPAPKINNMPTWHTPPPSFDPTSTDATHYWVVEATQFEPHQQTLPAVAKGDNLIAYLDRLQGPTLRAFGPFDSADPATSKDYQDRYKKQVAELGSPPTSPDSAFPDIILYGNTQGRIIEMQTFQEATALKKTLQGGL